MTSLGTAPCCAPLPFSSPKQELYKTYNQDLIFLHLNDHQRVELLGRFLGLERNGGIVNDEVGGVEIGAMEVVLVTESREGRRVEGKALKGGRLQDRTGDLRH